MRTDVVGVHILCRQLCVTARVFLRHRSLHVALRSLSTDTLAKHHVELRILELSGPVLVERVEDCVRVCLLNVEAESADGLVELLLVHVARTIIVPRPEEVTHAARRTHERVLERPLQVLGDIDLAAAINIERIEAFAQLRVRDLARLTVAHEIAEL